MTFSLVGRCARTGMLGAVVTTSSISVGSRCSHARAGIGAALTQHRTDPRLGPLALDLLAHGFSAPEAMQAVVAATPHRHWRQLALIDAAGRTAVYSGANVRAERGEAQGRDCAAIANIVRSASLPQAMVGAFEAQPDQPLALPGMNRNTGCTPLLQGRRGLVQHLEELCGVHGFDEVVESPGCI